MLSLMKAFLLACVHISLALDTSTVSSKLNDKRFKIRKIQTEVERQFRSYRKNHTSPSLDTCFGAAGLIAGKSLSGCGTELPATLNPRCDNFLGLTAGCKREGKHVTERVHSHCEPYMAHCPSKRALFSWNIYCVCGFLNLFVHCPC